MTHPVDGRSVPEDRDAATHALLRSAADVMTESVQWIWPGYLPLGMLTIIDGDPGLGKSTMLDDIVARLTSGRPMPGTNRAALGPAAALVLNAEDDPARVIKPRLEAASADLDLVVMPDNAIHSLDQKGLALIEHVATARPLRLVTIDPLMAYMPSGVNTHRDADVRVVLRSLTQLARKHDFAVIVARHLNKSIEGSALHRGGGSIGIVGAARAGFLVANDPNDQTGAGRILAPIKMNIAPEPEAQAFRITSDTTTASPPTVTWTGPSLQDADELLAPGARTPGEPHARAAAFLTGLLAHGPVPTREVKRLSAAAGYAWRTLERAKNTIGITSTRTSHDGGWAWTHIPQSTPQAPTPPPPADSTTHAPPGDADNDDMPPWLE